MRPWFQESLPRTCLSYLCRPREISLSLSTLRESWLACGAPERGDWGRDGCQVSGSRCPTYPPAVCLSAARACSPAWWVLLSRSLQLLHPLPLYSTRGASRWKPKGEDAREQSESRPVTLRSAFVTQKCRCFLQDILGARLYPLSGVSLSGRRHGMHDSSGVKFKASSTRARMRALSELPKSAEVRRKSGSNPPSRPSRHA